MKKKLLFILDTFHPEYASTGQLMTELARSLQDDFDITVIVKQASFHSARVPDPMNKVQEIN